MTAPAVPSGDQAEPLCICNGYSLACPRHGMSGDPVSVSAVPTDPEPTRPKADPWPELRGSAAVSLDPTDLRAALAAPPANCDSGSIDAVMPIFEAALAQAVTAERDRCMAITQEHLRKAFAETAAAEAQFADANARTYVGVGEAADILGVSKQRVHQLAHTDTFPAPAFRLRATPVWLEADIRAFATGRAALGAVHADNETRT